MLVQVFVNESARQPKSSAKTTANKPGKIMGTPKEGTTKVPDLGSSQYHEAAVVLAKVLDRLKKPPTVESVLADLGVKVAYTAKLTDKQAVAVLRKQYGGNYKTVEESFAWAKNEAHDLWTWANAASKACFKGLKLSQAGKSTNKSWPPNNLKTGAQCVLLLTNKFVKNLRAFKGFDT